MRPLDELVSLAQSYLSGAKSASDGSAADMAVAILDLFGEAPPCGWPEPEVFETNEPGRYRIEWEVMPLGDFDSADARAFGRMWFRAADANDKENAE